MTFFYVNTSSAESGYPKITDGKISENASYSYVTFPVMAGEPVIYATKTTESIAGIVFYDLDGVFISGVAAKNTPQTIIVPTGAAIAKAGYRTAEVDFFNVSIASNITTVAQVNNSLAAYDREKNDGKTGEIYTGYANTSTGNMSTNASFAHYKIAVYPGEKVIYKTGTNESTVGIVFFNERKKYISGIAATKEKQTIIVPQGASMAVAAYRVGQESSFVLITDVTVQRAFDIPILSPVYLPKFVLPQKVIAVVGHEWNLFYDNIIRGMDFGRYAVNIKLVTGSVSNKKCFEKFFRILPQIGDIGSHTVTLQIIDKVYGIAVDEAIFELVVIADTAQTGKKVMFIGDSLTNAGVYAAEIQYNLSNGGIVSVGTRQSTVTLNDISLTVNHEGRSGWASYDYTRSVQQYKTDVSNPFWDGEKFNFAYYMANANVDTPDIVCIGLGTNGGSASIADIQTMVNSIHEYNNGIPVLISLITPPAGQDGCGYLVGMQNADLLKTDFLDVVESYINSYEDGDNTDIVALYFQLDREHDFDVVNVSASARNPEIIPIQANNVHPSIYGYLHFADAYYNRILYTLTNIS